MGNRRSFKADEKAKIVLKILMEGCALNEMADVYKIHPSQLSRWKAVFIKNAGRAFK